jgi:hypothetical protein
VPIFVVSVCPFVFIWQLKWNRFSWKFILQNWIERWHNLHILVKFKHNLGTRWRNCLRHCATRRMVVVSFLDDVSGMFHWLNPSSRTMALQSTQTVPGIYPEGWRRLTTLPPSCADCLKIWKLQPSGTLRAFPGLSRPVQGLLYLYLRTQMTGTWQEDGVCIYTHVDWKSLNIHRKLVCCEPNGTETQSAHFVSIYYIDDLL